MRLEKEQTIWSGSNYIRVSDLNDLTWIHSKGLVLPKTSYTGVDAKEGTIRYNAEGKKVEFHNGSGWVDIGTGSGGGDSVWSLGFGGAYYSGNKVTISNAVQTGFFFDTALTEVQFADNYANRNYIKLDCDTTANWDCGSFQEAYGYGYNDYGYDEVYGTENRCPPGAEYLPSTDKCRDYLGDKGDFDPYTKWIYAFSDSLRTNTATLDVANVSAKNINVGNLTSSGNITASSNVWNDVTEYGRQGDIILTVGDTYNSAPTIYNPTYTDTQYSRGVSCPDGYYVVGIEVHNDDSGSKALTAIGLRCAKL